MDRWYWDTSALLKLYCPESDSVEYIRHFSEVEGLFLSSLIVDIEIFYAIQQKRFRNEISPTEANVAYLQYLDDKTQGQFELLPLSESIAETARDLWSQCEVEPRLTIRTLDGIHLATAKNAQCTQLVTADNRMQQIGRRLSLATPEICAQS